MAEDDYYRWSNIATYTDGIKTSSKWQYEPDLVPIGEGEKGILEAPEIATYARSASGFTYNKDINVNKDWTIQNLEYTSPVSSSGKKVISFVYSVLIRWLL